jgi:hypothetical protein
LRGGAGDARRSAARVEFENLTEDLSLSHGARLFEPQLSVSLSSCAAALRGIFDAA